MRQRDKQASAERRRSGAFAGRHASSIRPSGRPVCVNESSGRPSEACHSTVMNPSDASSE